MKEVPIIAYADGGYEVRVSVPPDITVAALAAALFNAGMTPPPPVEYGSGAGDTTMKCFALVQSVNVLSLICQRTSYRTQRSRLVLLLVHRRILGWVLNVLLSRHYLLELPRACCRREWFLREWFLQEWFLQVSLQSLAYHQESQVSASAIRLQPMVLLPQAVILLQQRVCLRSAAHRSFAMRTTNPCRRFEYWTGRCVAKIEVEPNLAAGQGQWILNQLFCGVA
jgi:hypothetical protein